MCQNECKFEMQFCVKSDDIAYTFPEDTWHQNDVNAGFVSTLVRRHFNVICPLFKITWTSQHLWMAKWMDALQFYILSNRISVAKNGHI